MTYRIRVADLPISDAKEELRQLLRTSNARSLSSDEQDRWDALIAKVEDHQDQLARVRSAIGSGRVENGTPFTEGSGTGAGTVRAAGGDPWSERVDYRTASHADLRSLALTAIEKMAGGTPDTSRQYATEKLETLPLDPESRMEKYILTASHPDYLTAFARWMSDPERGHLEWTDEQRDAHRRVRLMERAMSLGAGGGASGGFLVPYQLDPAIIITSGGYSDPIRQIARVEVTAQNVTRFVTSLGVTSSWDPEAQEVSDDSPTLIQPAVTAYKGQTFTPVSVEVFEDATNLAQQIGVLFADSKASLEATAFTLGSGSAEPEGLVTRLVATGGGSVLALGTNVYATADLYAGQAALPYRWQGNSSWMSSLPALNAFRQLPQATGLNYSIVNDDTNPPVALGRPWYVNGAMDAALTGGAAHDYNVVIGDFKQYVVVDRVGTSIEFVPHLFAAANLRPTGQRGFLQHWRNGGDALVPAAFVALDWST